MSVSVNIVPLPDSLEMYGQPDPSSAYSLSGHVSVSLASVSSFFEGRKAVRLLLQSLIIKFEGQSELVTAETGYSAVRLCSITRELIINEPIELSNEGHEDSDESCSWNVVFNLPIPGWLPTSSTFGVVPHGEAAGNSYALYATAKFIHLDLLSSAKPWFFSSFCSSFRTKTRIVHSPRCDITIRRFMPTPAMPSSSASIFPLINYSAVPLPQPENDDAARESCHIPHDTLSKIQVLVAIPEHIDIDDPSFPLSLRLRTLDLPQAECKKLRMTDFHLDIEQIEKFRRSPSSEYTTQFPLPPSALQPPNKPLLNPHPMQMLYDLGIATGDLHHSVVRSFSLLSPEHTGRYRLAGDGYVFFDDAVEGGTSQQKWYSIQTTVPLAQDHIEKGGDEWTGTKKRRETEQSPLFVVRHKMHISISYTYDLDGGLDAPLGDQACESDEERGPERVSECMRFTVPLDFVRVEPPAHVICTPPLSPTTSVSSSSAASLCLPSMSSSPYASTLPAYSQLFHSNGDRKIDYSVPLPLYSPPSPSSSSDFLLRYSDAET